MIGVGFTLQPEIEFLDLLHDLIRDEVDYYEVAPETLWRFGADGELRPNGFARHFLDLKAETGKPFAAHGVGYSVGTADVADDARLERWLARLQLDQDAFEFQWYTDHMGATAPAGLAITLPIPLPMTEARAAVVRGRLSRLQKIVPHVGVENTANYFVLGDPLDEPAFLMRAIDAPDMYLLLDLHNVHTMAVNLDFDPRVYLDRLDLSRVIEVHLAGGSDSPPAWLPSSRSLHLDSHEDAVPEAVWDLFDYALPRCTGLRGVTLERMEGTVVAADVPGLREELRRLRRLLASA